MRLRRLLPCGIVALFAATYPSVSLAQQQRAPAQQATTVARERGPLFTIEDALDLVSYSVADVTDDGRWVAATSTVRRDGFGTDYTRDGDPTYFREAKVRVWLIDATTGEQRAIFPDGRAVKALQWSPDGARLAMLSLAGEFFQPIIWERASGKVTTVRVPPGQYVAENSDLRWTSDGAGLLFALHSLAWRTTTQDEFARITRGPIMVQSSKDPFLAWDDMRRRATIRSIALHDLKLDKLRELVPEQRINSYTLSKDGSVLTFTEDLVKKTEYEQVPQDSKTLMVQVAGGPPQVLFATTRGMSLVWAPDGKTFTYAKDGKIFLASVSDKVGKQILGPQGNPFSDSTQRADTSRAARAVRDSLARLRFTVSRFSPSGDALLVSNRDGQFVMDLATGTRELVLPPADTTDLDAPRRSVTAWSEDGRWLYLGTTSRTQWERSIARYDRQSKQTTELVRDGRTYSGLRTFKDGNSVFINVADGNRPAEIFVADPTLRSMRRLVDPNPWMRDKKFGKTDLLTYADIDGKKRYGVVYYPADYQPGRAYPTVFIIYEEYFDDSWDATANVLTANGYVVVKPSVGFDIGFPGEAWLKGVTAAANKLVDLGVADSARLGVHGTSYGGFATNLLITQTNRFKAAINISGKVDMLSFYTDSPRLGIRNMSAAERSQDRIGATLWQQPQKYLQNSAILYADRIRTPLLLITGDQDPNVPAKNTSEMYYALRRLGKEVTWVNYMNGGHGAPGTTVTEWIDYHTRILEFYDQHLKRQKVKATTDSAGGR